MFQGGTPVLADKAPMIPVIRFIGIALVGAGVVLALLGLQAQDSFASSVTRLFSGSPTKESVMLLTGGGAALLCGVVLLVIPGSRPAGRRR